MEPSSGRGISTNEEEEEDDDGDGDKCGGNALQWDLGRIEYVESVKESLLCSGCHDVLKETVQSSCGERWHQACLKEVLASHGRCPICNELLNFKSCWRDIFADRELDGLYVFCIAKRNGCSWTGKRQSLKQHTAVCQFVELECTNGCGQIITRRELSEHLQLHCGHRFVSCSDCSSMLKSKNMKDHDTLCPKGPVECPNGCVFQTQLLREDLSDHLQECPKRTIRCPIVDCRTESTQEQLDLHCSQEVVSHTSMLNDACLSLQKSVALAQSSCEQKIRDIHEQVRVTQTVNQSLGTRLNSIENQLTEVNANSKIFYQKAVEASYQSVDNLKKEYSSKVESLDEQIRLLVQRMLKLEEITSMQASRIQHLEGQVAMNVKSSGMSESAHQMFTAHDRMLANHDIKLAEHELRLDMMDCKSTDGVLLWKITEIQRRRRDAVSGKTPSIYSQPFYTSPNGYKMCARLYLNGDGMGKGTHLSLFFVLMRGEYDSLLPWPFEHKVTLMLIDQLGRRHIMDTFQPDAASSSFKRPRSELNIATGCPLFVPLGTLDTGRYVQDDCMFIKMIINTTNVCRPDGRL